MYLNSILLLNVRSTYSLKPPQSCRSPSQNETFNIVACIKFVAYHYIVDGGLHLSLSLDKLVTQLPLVFFFFWIFEWIFKASPENLNSIAIFLVLQESCFCLLGFCFEQPFAELMVMECGIQLMSFNICFLVSFYSWLLSLLSRYLDIYCLSGKPCRSSCRRRVPLASDNYGSSRQPLCWGCVPCIHPFPSRLSLQASKGITHQECTYII